MDLKNNKITVGELLDSPAARAVFQRRFPMVMKHPLLGAGAGDLLRPGLRTAKDHPGDPERTAPCIRKGRSGLCPTPAAGGLLNAAVWEMTLLENVSQPVCKKPPQGLCAAFGRNAFCRVIAAQQPRRTPSGAVVRRRAAASGTCRTDPSLPVRERVMPHGVWPGDTSAAPPCPAPAAAHKK